MEDKSRKPGISAPEQDHINKTIITLRKGFEDLKRIEQSVNFDPERDDFVNPLDPVETNETGIPTSVPERISRSFEVTADKRIKDFRNQEKVEEDKEFSPQRPNKAKPIGGSLRNSSVDKSLTGPARVPLTDADKRPKTKTSPPSQKPTHEPTVQHEFDLREKSNLPEDLTIDQRKILLLGPEAQASRKTLHEGVQMGETRMVPSDRTMAVDTEFDPDYEEEFPSAKQREIGQRKSLDMNEETQSTQKPTDQHQHLLPPLLPDKSTEPDSNSGEEMNVEGGEEVTTAKYPKSVLRKGPDMGAADQTDRKSSNSEKKGTGPQTTLGSSNGDKLAMSDTSPELPFEHLTRGDLLTSKLWKILGLHGSFIPREPWNTVRPHTHSTPTYHNRKYSSPNQRKIQLCNREAQPEDNVYPRT